MKELDWKNLSFGYRPTDYNVRCYYRDGKWGEIEVCSDEYLKLHMAATCLHYGQEAFEGLKAYRCKDGKVRTFRVKDNAERFGFPLTRAVQHCISVRYSLVPVRRLAFTPLRNICL